jgi:hypothetical protein
MRMGWEAIRERQPLWIFEKLRDEMPNFWDADSLAVIHVKREAYAGVSVGADWAVAALVLLPYLAVLAGFVWGVVRVRWNRGLGLLILFLLYYNAIHIVTHGFARYRLPVMPVLFLVALGGLLAAGAGTISKTRRAAAILLALAFAVCLAPSIEKTIGHRAFGGSKYPRPSQEMPP